MSTDILGNFSPLDELIQLVYQNIYQFVVLSSVTYDRWTVHVGMVGDKGRWWRGVWVESDVVRVVGPKPSDKLLEKLVDNLVDMVVNGELYLTDFSTEEGAKIKLTFGPTSNKPMAMSLEEITPAEAAAHATNVFLEIALQAQSRRCRLHPSSFVSTTVHATASSAGDLDRNPGRVTGGSRDIESRKENPFPAADDRDHSRLPTRGKSPELLETREVEMKDEDDDDVEYSAKRKMKRGPQDSPPKVSTKQIEPQPGLKTKVPTRPANKGASLANPNKKARKFQAMEFASDDE